MDNSYSVDANGALPEGVEEGASVVLTGALQQDASFLASEVALQA